MKKNKTLSNRKTRTTMLKSIFAVVGVATISASVVSLVTSCSCSNQEWIVRGVFRYDKKTGRTLLGFKPDITQADIEKAFPNHILVLPNDFDNIDKYAFCNQSTGKTTIPNWITDLSFGENSSCQLIDNYAFKGAPFTGEVADAQKGLHFPSSVTAIGISAFEDNAKLKKIYIPKSVVTIGDNAFKNCHLQYIDCSEWDHIPQNWADAKNIFVGNEGLDRPGWFTLNKQPTGGITYETFCARWKAFFTTTYKFRFGADQNKYWKILPDDPEFEIFDITYEYDEQTGLIAKLNGFVEGFKPDTDPDRQKLIDYMKSISGEDKVFAIPPEVTVINSDAFDNIPNNFTKLKINDKCQAISSQAFKNLNLVQDIIFASSSVKSIGENAFMNCGNVANIDVRGYTTLPTWGDHLIFQGLVAKPSEQVDIKPQFKDYGGRVWTRYSIAKDWKQKMMDVWANGTVWGKSGNLYNWHTWPDSSTVLDISEDRSTVRGWVDGTTEEAVLAEFPDGVLYIPEDIKYVSPDAFIKIDGTGAIQTTIPKQLKKIVFHSDKTIISSLLEIGSRAFMNSPFVTVEIPNTIINIKSYAFYNSADLTTADLPVDSKRIGTNELLDIGVSAFANTKLTNSDTYIIPDYVQTIDDCAFYHTGLTSVTFQTKPTSISGGKLKLIDKLAFGHNQNLTTIDLTAWGTNAPEIGATFYSQIFDKSAVKGIVYLAKDFVLQNSWDPWLFNNGIAVEDKYWEAKSKA